MVFENMNNDQIDLQDINALADKKNVNSKIPLEIQDLCHAFIAVLEKDISFSQIILYGQNVESQNPIWSDVDVDLAIISEDFKGKSFSKRKFFLREVSLIAKTPRIEALGYTLDEFEQDKYPKIIKDFEVPFETKNSHHQSKDTKEEIPINRIF